MLKKIILTLIIFFYLTVPTLAVDSSNAVHKEVELYIGIIIGVLILTVVSFFSEMIAEAANKGKLKLYISMLSGIMILLIIFAFFIMAVVKVVSVGNMF